MIVMSLVVILSRKRSKKRSRESACISKPSCWYVILAFFPRELEICCNTYRKPENTNSYCYIIFTLYTSFHIYCLCKIKSTIIKTYLLEEKNWRFMWQSWKRREEQKSKRKHFGFVVKQGRQRHIYKTTGVSILC